MALGSRGERIGACEHQRSDAQRVAGTGREHEGGHAGGLRLRVRAPLTQAGKLSGVSVGGKAWTHFDAATETIDFSAAQLTKPLLETGLPSVVATFAC